MTFYVLSRLRRFHAMQRLALTITSVVVLTVFPNKLIAQAPVIDVIVQTAITQPITSTLEGLGTLRAWDSITLTPNVTKKITRINFDDGQRVERGQLLVEMTSNEESALLAEARFNAEEARKQQDRVAELVKTGAASQSLLDQRVREYEAARARYQATESRLKDLVLLAPFSGVIGLREVSVGALVSPGQTITTLFDDRKMKIDFTLPSVYLRYLRENAPITATTRDVEEGKFNGRIMSIDNQIDDVTRSIRVRAEINNPEFLLKHGMLMRIALETQPRESLLISESALVPLGGKNFVFVARTDGNESTVERREIVVGERLVGVVEVLSGLSAGEKIVTHGLQKIRAGQRVNIAAEENSVATRAEKKSLSTLLNNGN
jgi:membrane fusion protein (multidrug efflux system)